MPYNRKFPLQECFYRSLWEKLSFGKVSSRNKVYHALATNFASPLPTMPDWEVYVDVILVPSPWAFVCYEAVVLLWPLRLIDSYVCECWPRMYVCVPHLCLVPIGVIRGHQIPWKWSCCRQFWATMWTKPEHSAGAVSYLHSWNISTYPFFKTFCLKI